MRKHKYVRCLSGVLMTVMAFNLIMPSMAFAVDEQANESENVYVQDADEQSLSEKDSQTEQTDIIQDNGDTDKPEETGSIPATTYADFLSCLIELEKYADEFAAASNTEAIGLVINYIRTGVERYNTDSWAILAGAENTDFTAYVEEQDAANATNAHGLRGIGAFILPNGQTVEFDHMFGTMNIAFYNNYNETNADFGGWAGDICDLMEYSKGKLTSTDVETMAQEIQENYLGIDDEEAHSFGQCDIYGDLDAFYMITQLKSGSNKLSQIMENYYTEDLTDIDRAVFFLKNRFSGNITQDEIRKSLYDAYKGNSGVILLEADRNLTSDNDLRTACCYAFADYLYDLAKEELNNGEENENPYYSVFSSTSSTLAPGITQDINYAITADEKQIVYYIATVDVNRDDVSIYANYQNNDGSTWGMARVTDQMAAAQSKHTNPDDAEHYIDNYNTIVGVNADFYNMTTGQPSGALVMEGVTYHGVGSENFFAILKDGTSIIGGSAEWAAYKDQIQEAVGGSIYLIKDGKITVNSSSNYYDNRASRTCVGITADGKVVLMVLDGRQEPFSAGGSAEEIAQIMLEAGCVTAINLDGGGSSTFAAKEEGADKVTVVNRPSDGYERSVSSSLLVVSTAKTSNEFDHALITADTEYLTVGTSLDLSVCGVSESGNTAEIPGNAVLRLSNDNIAILENDVITATGKGDVTVELVVGDIVVGSKTFHVVEPDNLVFEKSVLNAIYGVEIPLPIVATYNGNEVAVNPDDISFELSSANAGTFNGFAFIGDEESGIRNVTVTASLTKDLSVHTDIEIALYKNGEAIFDFDNATEGDDSFAWNRDVSNSSTDDEEYYHVINPEEAMDISYIFALDMKEIPIPEQIKPLIALLPGGDSDTATAWDFLLQLAERVSVLTEVKVQLQVDPNLDIDYSEMTLVNEYFNMTSKEYDEETHTLTVVCNWIDQTQAIDPATANPICILSGIKVTPKEDAEWDESDCLQITNSGDVSYDIYLRSSTLYSVANDTSIQESYGLYPFVNPNDASEKGAHFGTVYATFEDKIKLDNSIWQGWIQSGNDMYYYQNNEPVTGIQSVPGYEDEDNTYYYQFDDNGVCQGKVSGLFETDGKKYYAVNGVLLSGWRVLQSETGEDQYYYFDLKTYEALDGTQTISGYHYVFENNVLKYGEWITDSVGIRYMWAGAFVYNKWFEVDGKLYYARPNTYLATGVHYNVSPDGSSNNTYIFADDGEWLKDYTGFYDYNGATYLMKDGVTVEHAGLVLIDGYYYYINSSNKVVKNCDYFISNTNDLMPRGTYHFDAEGKMVIEEEPEPEAKNGLIEEDGEFYYYVDGVKTHAGLIEIDGNYYYINSSCKAVRDCDYFISNTNDLMPRGTYHFDVEGKMVIEEPEPEVKNGLIEENGELYYYVDGVKTHAGLIEIDENYYYINSSCKAVRDCDYFISNTNDLMPRGTYHFDVEGKMVIEEPEPEVKNGLIEENGELYYYVDGVKTHAGLIEIDGNYYYINSSCKAVRDCDYFISNTNDLMARGTYHFDVDGKMVIE